MRRWTSYLSLALLAASSLAARAITVTATLDSEQAVVGEPSQLTVTVTGSQEQPTVPDIDGLDISLVGESTQIETVNGSTTSSVSTTYTVTPRRAGTFIIPAIHAGNAASQPITFHVSASGTSPAAANGPNSLPPPAVSSPGGDVTSTPASQNPYGSLQLVLPKKELYVGEMIPVDVRALVPEGVQLTMRELPQFAGDAFTTLPLSTNPEQATQEINGQVFSVYTWHTTITAVKPGNYPLSIRMPVAVLLPPQMPQIDQSDPLANFRSLMSSMGGTRKNLDLTNPPDSLNVLPLPTDNRPADFTGAVGQFEVEATATPTQVNAGDPVTLRLKISGQGNFDRVTSTMLPHSGPWKTYAPKSTFQPSDSVGFQGTKTFEQPVIPNDAGTTAVPALSFSFFDPEKRQFVTQTTAPVPLVVTGTSLSAPVTPPPVATASGPAPATAPADLRPNAIDTGTFVDSLQPVFLRPWFIGGQAVPLLAFLVGAGLIRRRRNASEPNRMRSIVLERAIREQIAAMDAAAREHQTAAFFIHARNALQQRFGQEWNMRPESITLADIEARAVGRAGNVRPIFEMADQASYSDLHLGDADLQQWREAVMTQLAEKMT